MELTQHKQARGGKGIGKCQWRNKDWGKRTGVECIKKIKHQSVIA